MSGLNEFTAREFIELLNAELEDESSSFRTRLIERAGHIKSIMTNDEMQILTPADGMSIWTAGHEIRLVVRMG